MLDKSIELLRSIFVLKSNLSYDPINEQLSKSEEKEIQAKSI